MPSLGYVISESPRMSRIRNAIREKKFNPRESIRDVWLKFSKITYFLIYFPDGIVRVPKLYTIVVYVGDFFPKLMWSIEICIVWNLI